MTDENVLKILILLTNRHTFPYTLVLRICFYVISTPYNWQFSFLPSHINFTLYYCIVRIQCIANGEMISNTNPPGNQSRLNKRNSKREKLCSWKNVIFTNLSSVSVNHSRGDLKDPIKKNKFSVTKNVPNSTFRSGVKTISESKSLLGWNLK